MEKFPKCGTEAHDFTFCLDLPKLKLNTISQIQRIGGSYEKLILRQLALDLPHSLQ